MLRLSHPEVSVLELLLFAVVTGFGIYLLRGFAKQADEVEDDSRHIYAGRERPPYGTKFVNILTGREDR